MSDLRATMEKRTEAGQAARSAYLTSANEWDEARDPEACIARLLDIASRLSGNSSPERRPPAFARMGSSVFELLVLRRLYRFGSIVSNEATIGLGLSLAESHRVIGSLVDRSLVDVRARTDNLFLSISVHALRAFDAITNTALREIGRAFNGIEPVIEGEIRTALRERPRRVRPSGTSRPGATINCHRSEREGWTPN